jgi:6-phosphofructokinase 1
MIDPSTGRMNVRRVDVNGEAYECARRYMIRLEAADFESSETLAKLAAAVNLSPAAFRSRFGYLVGVEPPPVVPSVEPSATVRR